jgi:hypothetical protein
VLSVMGAMMENSKRKGSSNTNDALKEENGLVGRRGAFVAARLELAGRFSA